MAKRNVPITYRKSFLAKYILSDDRVKEVYTILKNKILSIKGMKSRISWFYDAFNCGRCNFAKISVRGKYIALYLNLDTNDYPENIYHQENVSDRRRYKETSFKIHVKSDRTLKYAFRLIDDEVKKFDLKYGTLPHENYYLDYEEEGPLIERGLIAIDEKAMERTPKKFSTVSDVTLDVDTYDYNNDPDEFEDYRDVTYVDGTKVFVKERKCFQAKLIQSGELCQHYYSLLKNRLLSFIKVKNRISWKYEAFSINKVKLAHIQVRGKYCCLFLNLDPRKYKLKALGLENASKYELFEDTPLLIRIKNDDSINIAYDLINDLKRRFLLDEGFIKENHEYRFKYLTDKELKDKGMIKRYAKLGEYHSIEEEKYVNDLQSRKKNNFPVYKEEQRFVLGIDEENNFIETYETVKVPLEGKREVVYLDTINEFFEDGDLVDIDALKDKNIVDDDTKFYKLLYRGGTFDKKIEIVCHAVSPVALKICNQVGSEVDLEENL